MPHPVTPAHHSCLNRPPTAPNAQTELNATPRRRWSAQTFGSVAGKQRNQHHGRRQQQRQNDCG